MPPALAFRGANTESLADGRLSGARFKVKVDFENDNHCTEYLRFGIAKRLENVPLSFGTTYEKGLNGGDKKFEFHFVVTWFFK